MDLDLTDYYNTDLSKEDRAKFGDWLKDQSSKTGRDVKKDLYDYDLGGWFQKNGAQELSGAHLTDEYKKPNHPTFSNQSVYHGVDGVEGGQWDSNTDGSYTFTPGSTNTYDPTDLVDYFTTVEKGNKLNLPTK